MFQRCLICTDLSDGLHRLVQFVPSLAAGGLKQIIFYHSVSLWEEGEIPRIDTEKIAQAKNLLSVALQAVPSEIEVKIEVTSGRPLETIQKLASSYQPDVILLGMSPRSLLQEKLFGSTTAGIAKGTKTQLMILRPQLISTYTREELDLRCRHLWNYLLIPYNGSLVSQNIIKKIKQYVQNSAANSLQGCRLCWVVEDVHRRELSSDLQLQSALANLLTIKTDLQQLGLQVDIDVRLGNPVAEILAVAMEFDISAIAISSPHRNNIIEWSIPSFSGELMRRSWHPILLFPFNNYGMGNWGMRE